MLTLLLGTLIQNQKPRLDSDGMHGYISVNVPKPPPEYGVPNLRAAGLITKRHVANPTAMRGPDSVPGLFATKTAMDELAIALKMDPPPSSLSRIISK